MIFRLFSILFLLFLLSTGIFAQSINSIKKQKEKSEKEIVYLNKLLKEAMSNKSVSTEKLNILRQKIVESRKLLFVLNQEMKYLQGNIAGNEKRISELESEREAMLDLYAKLVYGSWKKRNKVDKLMFIFSSSDFNQAYNRFKYFQQIQEYSKRQLHLIRQVNDSLNRRNQNLKDLLVQKDAVANTINHRNQELESEQVKENQYMTQLQKKEKEVRKKLQVEMDNRKKLDKELNKLLARQTKKSGSTSSVYKLTPEEKLLSDDFVKNKGKLPWPVAEGFISEKFGVRVHPVHKYVMISNQGVNITTSKNAEVRAVFKGVVSDIGYLSGLHNIVVIRHGSYSTVYPNIVEMKVKKNDVVNTKDILGKIAYDEEKGSVLNFQILKDNVRLDPELWLAK